MRVGIVYYEDDPARRVFRIVYPEISESELDDPRWITEGLNPERTAFLEKVEPDDPRVLSGFSGTP